MKKMISWKTRLAGDEARRIDVTGMIVHASSNDNTQKGTRQQSNTCLDHFEERAKEVTKHMLYMRYYVNTTIPTCTDPEHRT